MAELEMGSIDPGGIGPALPSSELKTAVGSFTVEPVSPPVTWVKPYTTSRKHSASSSTSVPSSQCNNTESADIPRPVFTLQDGAAVKSPEFARKQTFYIEEDPPEKIEIRYKFVIDNLHPNKLKNSDLPKNQQTEKFSSVNNVGDDEEKGIQHPSSEGTKEEVKSEKESKEVTDGNERSETSKGVASDQSIGCDVKEKESGSHTGVADEEVSGTSVSTPANASTHVACDADDELQRAIRVLRGTSPSSQSIKSASSDVTSIKSNLKDSTVEQKNDQSKDSQSMKVASPASVVVGENANRTTSGTQTQRSFTKRHSPNRPVDLSPTGKSPSQLLKRISPDKLFPKPSPQTDPPNQGVPQGSVKLSKRESSPSSPVTSNESHKPSDKFLSYSLASNDHKNSNQHNKDTTPNGSYVMCLPPNRNGTIKDNIDDVMARADKVLVRTSDNESPKVTAQESTSLCSEDISKKDTGVDADKNAHTYSVIKDQDDTSTMIHDEATSEQSKTPDISKSEVLSDGKDVKSAVSPTNNKKHEPAPSRDKSDVKNASQSDKASSSKSRRKPLTERKLNAEDSDDHICLVSSCDDKCHLGLKTGEKCHLEPPKKRPQQPDVSTIAWPEPPKHLPPRKVSLLPSMPAIFEDNPSKSEEDQIFEQKCRRLRRSFSTDCGTVSGTHMWNSRLTGVSTCGAIINTVPSAIMSPSIMKKHTSDSKLASKSSRNISLADDDEMRNWSTHPGSGTLLDSMHRRHYPALYSQHGQSVSVDRLTEMAPDQHQNSMSHSKSDDMVLMSGLSDSSPQTKVGAERSFQTGAATLPMVRENKLRSPADVGQPCSRSDNDVSVGYHKKNQHAEHDRNCCADDRNTKDSCERDTTKETEAGEACKWLRATGFPQYAQMYEDDQFPIDVAAVQKDHDFLDSDSLQSLFRRLNTLNKCATMKIETPADKMGDESDEEEQCALSDKWQFERSNRRWSRKDLDSVVNNDGWLANKDALRSASSHDSVITDDNEENTSQQEDSPIMNSRKQPFGETKFPTPQPRTIRASSIDSSPRLVPQFSRAYSVERPPQLSPEFPHSAGSEVPGLLAKPKNVTASEINNKDGSWEFPWSPRLRRAASERFKGARNFLKRIESRKGSKKPLKKLTIPPEKIEISGPVVTDVEDMKKKMERLGCVEISPTRETTGLPNHVHQLDECPSLSDHSPHSLRGQSPASAGEQSPQAGVQSPRINISVPSDEESLHESDNVFYGEDTSNLLNSQSNHTAELRRHKPGQTSHHRTASMRCHDEYHVDPNHKPGAFPMFLSSGYVDMGNGNQVNIRTGSFSGGTRQRPHYQRNVNGVMERVPVNGAPERVQLRRSESAMGHTESKEHRGSLYDNVPFTSDLTPSSPTGLTDAQEELDNILHDLFRNIADLNKSLGDSTSPTPDFSCTSDLTSTRTLMISADSDTDHKVDKPSAHDAAATTSPSSTPLTQASTSTGLSTMAVLDDTTSIKSGSSLRSGSVESQHSASNAASLGSQSGSNAGSIGSHDLLQDTSSKHTSEDHPHEHIDFLAEFTQQDIDAVAEQEQVDEGASLTDDPDVTSDLDTHGESPNDDGAESPDLGEFRERRDSGVGSSLTRAPSEHRRHRIRWHSFIKSHRPSLSSRNLQLDSMSAGQLMVLRKLALLKVTAIMDRYCPPNRAGWNWFVPKLMRRWKVPDYKDKNVFGVPLLVVLQRSNQPLPQCVLYAMRCLRRTAADALGIFRKSGVRSRIQKLRNQLEAAPDSIDFEALQAYDVADLLKQYFRELPECLLTNKLSDTFIAIFTHVPSELRLEALQAAMLLLPDENRQVLQCLLLFLKDMAQHASQNQMTASNLAVCFAPSLCHIACASRGNPTSSPKWGHKQASGLPDQRELLEQKAAQECLTVMINESKKMFMVPEDMLSKCRLSYIELGDPVPIYDLAKRGSDSSSEADYTAHIESSIQGLLKESRDKFKGWVSVSSPPPTEVSYKKVDDGHPLRLWKCCIDVEAPPIEVLNRILRERHVWDEDLLKWRVVEHISANTEVFQYILNSMAPHAQRDFVELRSWRTELSKGACVLVSTSVEHPEAALIGGVRAVVLASRFLIEPCGAGKSRLTHICRIDLRGSKPEWYNKAFGYICANYAIRIRDSFQSGIASTDGPETKV